MYKKIIALSVIIAFFNASAAEIGSNERKVSAQQREYSQEQQDLLRTFRVLYDDEKIEWPNISSHAMDLLEQGIHPDDLVDTEKVSILNEGIENDDIPFIRKWLDRGGNPNKLCGIYHGLEYVESIPMARLLVDSKADMSAFSTPYEPNLLFAGCCRKNPEVGLFFWHRGVDSSILNSEGHSALDYAIQCVKSIDRLEGIIHFYIAMGVPVKLDLMDRFYDGSEEVFRCEGDKKRIMAAIEASRSKQGKAKKFIWDILITHLPLARIIPIVQEYRGPTVDPRVAEKLRGLKDRE